MWESCLTDNTNWLENDDPDSWFGVTVAGGHVTRLEFLVNNLTGQLPHAGLCPGSTGLISLTAMDRPVMRWAFGIVSKSRWTDPVTLIERGQLTHEVLRF